MFVFLLLRFPFIGFYSIFCKMFSYKRLNGHTSAYITELPILHRARTQIIKTYVCPEILFFSCVCCKVLWLNYVEFHSRHHLFKSGLYAKTKCDSFEGHENWILNFLVHLWLVGLPFRHVRNQSMLIKRPTVSMLLLLVIFGRFFPCVNQGSHDTGCHIKVSCMCVCM